MATRLAIQAPKTGLADETIKFRCEDCDDVDIVNPETHAKLKHNEKNIIVDTSMKNWYGGLSK